MKLLTTICMPALMLGAAAFVTPALAQADAGNAAAASPAQPAQDANSAAVPAQPAPSAQPMQGAMGAQPSADTSASALSSSNTAGDEYDRQCERFFHRPDNQHKYSAPSAIRTIARKIKPPSS